MVLRVWGLGLTRCPYAEPRTKNVPKAAFLNLKGKHSKLKSSNLFAWGENN